MGISSEELFSLFMFLLEGNWFDFGILLGIGPKLFPYSMCLDLKLNVMKSHQSIHLFLTVMHGF